MQFVNKIMNALARASYVVVFSMRGLERQLFSLVRLSVWMMCVWVCFGTEKLTAVSGIPIIQIDGAGNAVAVWENTDVGGDGIIQAATRPFAGNWTAPVTISTTGTNALAPKLVINSAGVAVVGWIVKDDLLGIRSLYVAIRNVSWGAAVRISTTDQHVQQFDMHIAISSDVTAVWRSRSVSSDTDSSSRNFIYKGSSINPTSPTSSSSAN